MTTHRWGLDLVTGMPCIRHGLPRPCEVGMGGFQKGRRPQQVLILPHSTSIFAYGATRQSAPALHPPQQLHTMTEGCSDAPWPLQLKELILRKDALVAARATPPYYLKADLRTQPLNVDTFGTKFDVVRRPRRSV
jgi:hypothetical protein